MSLTVPMAGLTAGRAAQPQFEAPQTGAVIAQFGDAVKLVGDKLEKQRLDLEMGQLQLDMTKDMNALRLKYEASGDPEAIDKGWSHDIQALRASYFDDATGTGRPRVDPKIRAQFGLMFDELDQRHAFALGQRNVMLRQSAQVAAYRTYSAEAAKAAVDTPDLATRETLYRQHDEAVDRQVAAGSMTPKQGQDEKASFRSSTDENVAQGTLTDNPRLLLEQLNAGALPNLTADQRTTLRTQAMTAIKTLDAKAAKAAELEVKAADDAQKAAIGDGIKIMEKGLPWRDEKMLDDPAIAQKFPDQVAEAQAARALRDQGHIIAQMTPAELATVRADLIKGGLDKDWQTKAVTMIDKRIDQSRTDWAMDGIKAATAAGLPVPPLPSFDPANTDAFAQAIARRLQFADWAKQKGYADKVAPFSAAEAEALKPVLAPTAPTDQRLAAALAFAQGGGEGADRAARAAGASDVFVQALDALAIGQDPAIARSMLRGEGLKAAGTVDLPPETQLQSAFAAEVGGVMSDNPEDRKAFYLAAVAIFADKVGRIDPADMAGDWQSGEAGKVFRQSIQLAFGGAEDGKAGVGGIQPIGGRQVMLPPGMPAQAVQDAWDRVGLELHGPALRNGQPVAYDAAGNVIEDPAVGLAILTTASKSGAPPNLGSSPADFFGSGGLGLKAVGGDSYALSYMSNGRELLVPDENGNPFVLSLRALVKATGELPP